MTRTSLNSERTRLPWIIQAKTTRNICIQNSEGRIPYGREENALWKTGNRPPKENQSVLGSGFFGGGHCLTIHQHWKQGNNLRRKIDKHLLLIFFSLFLDGSYLTFENWQSIKDKSDREVKELLECYGKKCKQQKVCDSDSATLKFSLRLDRCWDELHSWTSLEMLIVNCLAVWQWYGHPL